MTRIRCGVTWKQTQVERGFRLYVDRGGIDHSAELSTESLQRNSNQAQYRVMGMLFAQIKRRGKIERFSTYEALSKGTT
jgi:hypothetical protein